MKDHLALFFFSLASAAFVLDADAQPQPGSSFFFGSNELPPANGMYLSPAESSIMTGNGVIVSNLTLRTVTHSVPAPPPGTSAVLPFEAQVEFDYSLDGGKTFAQGSATASGLVALQFLQSAGAQMTYSTEVQQLTFSADFPGGLMVRESPGLSSTGETVLQPGTGGGYWIGGYFNGFFEMSTDGGQTWMPADAAQRFELRVDPGTVAPVPEPSPLFPPPVDQLVMPVQDVATFAGDIQIKGLRQTLYSQALDASLIAAGSKAVVLPYTSAIDFQLSLDGGKTFVPIRTSGNVSIALQKLRETPAQLLDAEMGQMDFSGQIPGAVIMIRESPTLPSYGGVEIQPPADGTFEFHGFFDVCLEVSTDGGGHWQPADNGPVHLELHGNSPRNQFASSDMPPPGSEYAWPEGAIQTYQTGGSAVMIRDGRFSGFSTSSPPPPAGVPLVQDFTGQLSLLMSLDGGTTLTSVTGTVSAILQVNRGTSWSNTTYYDTELLQLDVSGLPEGTMLRESPTHSSTGRLSIQPGANGFRIASFFDVWTELSLDSGQSWDSAFEGPVIWGTHPSVPFAPLSVSCPEDITVITANLGGVPVNYGLPLVQLGDCPLSPYPTVSCVPPSGSLFPIGTTTVQCEAHDGCGEHVMCSFEVTVLPLLPLIPNFTFARVVLPPPRGLYLKPAEFQPLSDGPIIFRNLALRNFPRSIPPPQPGTSFTFPTEPMAEFDWSMDGGASFEHGGALASMWLNIQDNGPGQNPDEEIYNSRILRLDISGGDLPDTVMLRANPTQPSTGQTSIRRLDADHGQALIGSFFDVYFQVSLDGGQTWDSARTPQHFELRLDPQTLTTAPEFSPLSPPPEDQFASTPEVMAMFTGGAQIKNVRSKLFSQSFDTALLEMSDTPLRQQFDCSVYLQWSPGGGAAFASGRAPATLTLALLPLMRTESGVIVDVEMVQMDIEGGDLPPELRVRESPTVKSHGQMVFDSMADGSFAASGFFDVYFEMSADGGQTWQPAEGPLHFDLVRNSLRASFASNTFPPAGQFVWPEGAMQTYNVGGSNIIVANGSLHDFTEFYPLPPPGQTQFENFAAQMDLEVSMDGGQTFAAYSAPVAGYMQVTGNSGLNWGDRRYFDTELLQLDVSGGTLPRGLMLRESAERASVGRASIHANGSDGFRMDSFFDVFTELSLDGGQNWDQAYEGPVLAGVYPPVMPPYAPYVLNCPSNFIAIAGSPNGTVVNYSLQPTIVLPDCPLCCFTATCTPPSGSWFPLGSTTVHCVGNDGCGETPTCSFIVTVLPGYLFAGLVHSVLGNAVLDTSQPGTGEPISLVVSNLGPGGTDGFHINLGGADSAVLNFQPFPTTVNTCIVTMATGPYALQADHPLCVATYFGGSNPIVRADFSSIGATSVVAQVRDEDHHLVSSSIVGNNEWIDINSLFPPPCSNINSTVYTYWQGPDYACYRFCRFGCDCAGTNCYIERVVCLKADIASALKPSSLSGMDLYAQGVSVPASLTIQSIDIGAFGNLHQPTGDANFEMEKGLLTVNNLGSNGVDGVTVNLHQVGRFDLALAPARLLANGACFHVGVAGEMDGLPAIQIGSMTLSDDGGGGLQVGGDFGGVNATMVRVEIYDGLTLQGGILLPAVQLGTLTGAGNLIGCGALPPATPGLWVRFDSPFTFEGSSGARFSGDQIRVVAPDGTAKAQNLSQFSIQACNLGQLAIIDERSTPLIGAVARVSGGGVSLIGHGVAGTIYRLEATPLLGLQTKWQTLDSAEADVDGVVELSDPRSAEQQFYRVVSP